MFRTQYMHGAKSKLRSAYLYIINVNISRVICNISVYMIQLNSTRCKLLIII